MCSLLQKFFLAFYSLFDILEIGVIYMTTGQRIKEARKKAGLTQKELGAKLGVAYQTLAQWENDLRNPKQETIQRIANALDCDFYWLLWGENLSIEDRQALNVMRVFGTNDYHIQKAAKLAVYYAECEHKSRGYSFGKTEEELIKSFSELNDDGQREAVKRVEYLTEVKEFKRQPRQEPPAATSEGRDTTPTENAATGPQEGK